MVAAPFTAHPRHLGMAPVTALEVHGGLSEAEARSLTDEVKGDAERLWRKLVELYDGKAHLSLGYSSWDGYFTAEFGGSKSRAYQLLDAGRVLKLAQSTMVDSAPTERQARELAPLLDQPEELQAAWTEAVEQHGEPTAAQVREVVQDRKNVQTAALKSSESDEWYTPPRYMDVVRRFLGTIDLDPASHVIANEHVGAERFFAIEDDGLAQEWHGRVFLNPPYGTKCPAFVAKLQAEYAAARTREAVLLVSAYSTETRWFQPLFNYPICFVNHRIKFIDSDTNAGAGSSTIGNAFVYMGARTSAFAEAFSELGAVIRSVVPAGVRRAA